MRSNVTKKPRCHWDADRGWCTPEHQRDCADRDCTGCRPCAKTHCAMRGSCPSHVKPEAEERTCAACIGKARRNLDKIEQLYALADTDVEARHDEIGALLEQAAESGVDSEAFNLVGPAADPGQWAERRRRLQAAYDASGLCAWPRHEALSEDDPQHPYAVLGRWEMALRETYGLHTDLLTSVSRAADFLRRMLGETFPHGDEFEDFDREIHACREHLEAVVQDSHEPEKGAPCPTCSAELGKAPRLRKRYAVHPGLPPGKRCAAREGQCRICTGKDDTWHCPDNAAHWYTQHEYETRVDRDYVRHADQLPARELAERIGVPLSTLRKWAARTWDAQAKTWREPRLVSRRRAADGRKLYRVADALRLAEKRSA